MISASLATWAKGNKALWDKFMSYYSAVFAEGALTEREKALIALAVAHTVQCPYCIDAYTQASLEKGSNVEEMTEADPRSLRHPRRSLAGSRRTDAQRGREAVDVRRIQNVCLISTGRDVPEWPSVKYLAPFFVQHPSRADQVDQCRFN